MSYNLSFNFKLFEVFFSCAIYLIFDFKDIEKKLTPDVVEFDWFEL